MPLALLLGVTHSSTLRKGTVLWAAEPPSGEATWFHCAVSSQHPQVLSSCGCFIAFSNCNFKFIEHNKMLEL